MENILKIISQKRNRFNENLKRKLDNLSPDTKLNSILIVLLLYAVITVIMLVSAFRDNESDMAIKHIEPAPLIDTKPAFPVGTFPGEGQTAVHLEHLND